VHSRKETSPSPPPTGKKVFLTWPDNIQQISDNSEYLGSISSIFFKQLLHAQIQKVQKDTDNLTVFLHLWGSSEVKAARKLVGEIDL
jgi:hypothetical protein